MRRTYWRGTMHGICRTGEVVVALPGRGPLDPAAHLAALALLHEREPDRLPGHVRHAHPQHKFVEKRIGKGVTRIGAPGHLAHGRRLFVSAGTGSGRVGDDAEVPARFEASA